MESPYLGRPQAPSWGLPRDGLGHGLGRARGDVVWGLGSLWGLLQRMISDKSCKQGMQRNLRMRCTDTVCAIYSNCYTCVFFARTMSLTGIQPTRTTPTIDVAVEALTFEHTRGQQEGCRQRSTQTWWCKNFKAVLQKSPLMLP